MRQKSGVKLIEKIKDLIKEEETPKEKLTDKIVDFLSLTKNYRLFLLGNFFLLCFFTFIQILNLVFLIMNIKGGQ